MKYRYPLIGVRTESITILNDGDGYGDGDNGDDEGDGRSLFKICAEDEGGVYYDEIQYFGKTFFVEY